MQNISSDFRRTSSTLMFLNLQKRRKCEYDVVGKLASRERISNWQPFHKSAQRAHLPSCVESLSSALERSPMDAMASRLTNGDLRKGPVKAYSLLNEWADPIAFSEIAKYQPMMCFTLEVFQRPHSWERDRGGDTQDIHNIFEQNEINSEQNRQKSNFQDDETSLFGAPSFYRVQGHEEQLPLLIRRRNLINSEIIWKSEFETTGQSVTHC